MKKRIIISVLTMSILLSCGPSQSRQEKRIGINGEAIYVFNKDGSIKSIFKEKYSIHDFTVLIHKDTLLLGDTFISGIHVTSSSYRISIQSPKPMEISSNEVSGLAKYNFLPTTEGIYDYKGTIEFDSTIVPFEYKFIVIDSK